MLQQMALWKWLQSFHSMHASRHLFFLLCHRLDASRHFLANFLVISNHIRHLSFTDCFEGEGLASDPNNCLQTLSKPFLAFPRKLPYTRTGIALANAVYHQCLKWKRFYSIFNLPLHHCTAYFYSFTATGTIHYTLNTIHHTLNTIH